MHPDPTIDKLTQIFLPNAYDRAKAVAMNGTRFAHYTTADAALSILKSKEVWMRKSSCMNDFTEVQHGLNCLYAAYNDKSANSAGIKFRQVLDDLFDGMRGEIEQLFNGWAQHFQWDTYFTCFSEHKNDEDTIGRLSMWRAYGENTGVAFVLNNKPFLGTSAALKAYASPVAYMRDDGLQKELNRLAHNIVSNAPFIRSCGRELAKTLVFTALRFAALCTKHPGFSEELEWRIVYTPLYDKSERLIKDTKIIKGTPQPIYRIPLRDIPDEQLVGIEIPELVDRIIIGPSQYPVAIREAFVDLLTEVGVKDAGSKVFTSDIPVRR